MSRKVLTTLAIVLFLAAIAVAAPVTGAIFTTTASGTVVNGNVYDNKTDVFLNGGPQPNAPCSAAGLADGSYYFQVTDPSGAVLLSNDDISNRMVTVSGGLITGYSGTHAVGSGKCGSLSVGLAPFDDTPNSGGEYKVWMTPVGSYDPNDLNSTFGFANNQSKTDNYKVRPQDPPSKIAIIGHKYYDANTNGILDAGEVTIAGWKIVNTPPVDGEVTFTDTQSASIGQYSFLVDPNSGMYTFTEIMPGPSWHATAPMSGSVEAGSSDVAGPDFFNVCVGAGGGLTLGFWSNKNGQATMAASGGDLGLLGALNLRNATGADFNPTSYTQFRTWILGASATNMAYMLSAQLAAMELNVYNGKVNGNALIYAPGTASANPAGFATVNAIMAEANATLGANGSVFDGNPERAHQEALKNALDNANNNRTFVQSGPCDFTY